MTTPTWLTVLKFIAALGSGLVAGVFFAFSTFVMTALGRIPAAHGIAAMQNINVTVFNPLFMGAFMGTAALCFGLGILAPFKWSLPGTPWMLAGCLLYFFGTFAVTAAGNVPLNDALAAVRPDSPEAPKLWANYLMMWTLWNHVRTAASTAALASFIMSLIQQS